MDVLNLYNQISQAADDALQRTSALLKQSQALSTLKIGAGTIAQGALGPGLMLLDPMEKFVKGEATFRKATQQFTLDLKALEVGGKVASGGFEKLGTSIGRHSETIEKGFKRLSVWATEFTKTSTMMDSTIVKLAGRSGMLATSFRGMAQAVKLFTGPVGITLAATGLIYDNFVSKWIDNSIKLQKSIEATASLFGGNKFAVSVAMDRYAATGGGRQEFLGLAQRGGFTKEIPVELAAQIAEISKITARQLGKTQAEEFSKYMQHFGSRVMQGAGGEVLRQEILRTRVLAGGPGAATTVQSPLERYQEWGEDVGRKLGIAGEGWSPSNIWRRQAYMMPGDKFGRAGAWSRGMANEATRFAPLAIPGLMPLKLATESFADETARRSITQTFEGGMKYLERGRARMEAPGEGRRQDQAGSLLNIGRLLSFFPGLGGVTAGLPMLPGALGIGSREDQIAKGIAETQIGGRDIVDSYRRAMEYNLEVKRPEMSKEAQQLAQDEALIKAKEMYQYAKSAATPAADQKEQLARLLSEGKYKEAEQYSEGFLSDEKIAEGLSAYDKYGHEFNKVTPKFEADVAKRRREFEEQMKLRETQQKMAKSLGKFSGVPEAGKMTFQDIMSAATPVAEVEKAEREYQSGLITKQQELMKLQNMSVRDKNQDAKIEELKAQLKGSELPRPELTVKEKEEYKQKLEEDVEEAEKWKTGILQKRAEEQTSPDLKMQQARIMRLRQEQTKIDQQMEKDRVEFMNKMLPAQIDELKARGIINEGEQTRLRGIGKGGYGVITGQDTQREIQKALQEHGVKLQEAETLYTPRRRELQGAGLMAQARELGMSGVMDEGAIKRIQGLVQKGDEVSLKHAEQILSLTQQRYQIEQSIVVTKIKGIEREGRRGQIDLSLEIAQREGYGGNYGAISEARGGGVRQFDEASPVIQNILNLRKKQFDDELAFTKQYVQLRTEVIKTHYDNIINMEQAKLEQKDRQYAPHARYGGEFYGAERTVAQAQMSRYTGQDYRRQLMRTERGLREEGFNLLTSLGGGEVPREVQAARAMRGYRERREDLEREKKRQQEADNQEISGVAGTMRGIRGTGIDTGRFYQSEQGRNLLMQMYQQSQGAFGRQGIDVSGQITRLAREQQEQSAQRLALEMRARETKTKSLEEQIGVMEEESKKLKPGQQERMKAQLAEKYGEAAQHYLGTGDIEKAKEYQERQEELLEEIPAVFKKDFGDVQKQTLTELQTQTDILKAINTSLGGENPEVGEEVGSGIESGAGEATGDMKGGRGFRARYDELMTEYAEKSKETANTMKDAAETMKEAAEKQANTVIQVKVEGGIATVNSGGAGAFGPGV